MKQEVKDSIAITFDVDWALDEIIQYSVNLLEKYRVKATFFATHKSDCLNSLDRIRYEVGLHPNFNQGIDYDGVIKRLKVLYPEAIGVRSHYLFQSSQILERFIDNGLKYEANTFVPLQEDLHPFVRINKIISIPFYWGDDHHFSTGGNFKFPQLQIHRTGLKIYCFHPIHVFMNTNSSEHYDSFKPYYHEPEMLLKYRNNGKGIGTLFEELLQYLSENKLPTLTCNEIYEQYVTTGKSL